MALGVVVLLAVQSPDTTTYADLATLELMQLARERHRAQDTLVHDYQARLLTRMEVRAGRSIFARLRPLWVHETSARMSWAQPNDINLRMEGQRGRTIFEGVEGHVRFDRPWFVPRALGDSVRLLSIPSTAALHPLAFDAEDWYRYAIVDSAVISTPGHTVRAVSIKVEPKRMGPSLVAGAMWVDRATGDVVRLSVTFLGDFVWEAPEGETPEDSARARRETRTAQRFVSVHADLEYLLVDDRYWMPWRQLLSINASLNFIVSATMPARILTTFHDTRVNTGVPVVFTLEPDSGRTTRRRVHYPDDRRDVRGAVADTFGYTITGRTAAMRWETTSPPRDSLRAFQWAAPLEADITPVDRQRVERFIADMERLTETMPAEWMARQTLQLAWTDPADIVRFNRVQGTSIGAGVTVHPGLAFTDLHVGARFGFGDTRFTSTIALRRDAPGGRLDVSAFRHIAEAEPWSRGQGSGNSLNAQFTGHDDADYYLQSGGSARYEFYRGSLSNWTVGASASRHRSIATQAGAGISDLYGSGTLAPNPAVTDGDWVGGHISRRLGGPLRGTLGAEALVGKSGEGARVWLDASVPFSVFRRTGRLSLKGGTTAGDPLPQLAFRLGGPYTVRGYGYGEAIVPDLWAAQLDIALRPRWAITPVIFADVGGFDFRNDPLVSVGGGLSIFGGWLRLNLAKGLQPERRVRFDVLFGAPR